VTTEHLLVLRKALGLVDTKTLSRYEQPDDGKVAKIAISLHRTQVLMNPVIVDLERKLLIDGHHRVEAFEWLRLSHIPCYSVNYLSPQVEACDWSRVTRASPDDVREAFSVVAGGRGGPWTVSSLLRTETIAHRSFDNAFSGARFQERVSACLTEMGQSIALEAPGAEADGQIRNRLEPIVGKPEVLAAIDQKRLFPHEINRHLVDGRPLAMDIPLATLKSEATFERYLDKLFVETNPTLLEAGHRHQARLYEERVTTFSRQRER
jgi:hypothetical protein